MPGNQHNSRKMDLLSYLDIARDYLKEGDIDMARGWLRCFYLGYTKAPASTRRRWRCGR